MKIEGMIVSNTTISREALSSDPKAVQSIGAGGLSGAPIQEKSNSVLEKTKQLAKDLPIIGVGGINSGDAAQEKIKLGADLVQVYSGLVYEGPFLVKRIKKALLN